MLPNTQQLNYFQILRKVAGGDSWRGEERSFQKVF